MSVWREVQEALYQRFENGWVFNGAVLTPFAFGNEKIDPPADAWARVSATRLPGGSGTLGPRGNRKMDRAGLLFVQLFTPLGEGTGRSSDLGELAAKLFENCRLTPHDIRFAAVEPGEGREIEGGRWWGLNVEGRFDYEEHN